MNTRGIRIFALVLCLAITAVSRNSFAIDSNQLFSVTITNGTHIVPRTIFTQTWTMTNCGTTIWTPSGYTLNLVGEDSLGAMPLITNTAAGTYHFPRCSINGGKTVVPNGTGSFSIQFIAPEASGSYTDYFQMNNPSSAFFGPTVTVQVAVSGGNTNVYDRARAVSYANNYAAYVCSDGYFWTNGDYPDFGYYGTNVFTTCPVDTAGDDCAHFVSCCIGSEPHLRGAGMIIPSRTTPTYGEPSASRIVNTVLVAPGYAREVSSLSQMEPGDVIGWNWGYSGIDTNVQDLDHVTLYLGNSLIAAHATSQLDVGPTHYQGSSVTWHLIHILDYPTLNALKSGNKYILSWTTNWNKYALYQASSSTGPWSKVTGTKAVAGINYLTNTISPSATSWFFRLEMP